MATAGRITVVDAEEILDDDHIDPESVMTPGICVQRLVRSVPRTKDIEQRTVRPRVDA